MSCENFTLDESTNPISLVSLFDRIAVDPDRAFGLSAIQIAALLTKCAAEETKLSSIHSALAAALFSSDQCRQGGTGPQAETRLLTVAEAAAKLSVTREWLYRRGKSLGLAVKLSDGTLRFSSIALDEYINRQTFSPVNRRRRAKTRDLTY